MSAVSWPSPSLDLCSRRIPLEGPFTAASTAGRSPLRVQDLQVIETTACQAATVHPTHQAPSLATVSLGPHATGLHEDARKVLEEDVAGPGRHCDRNTSGEREKTSDSELIRF